MTQFVFSNLPDILLIPELLMLWGQMGLVMLVLAKRLIVLGHRFRECPLLAVDIKDICLVSVCNGVSFSLFPLQVNHLSKRHPDMKIEEVPELTLPIIKPNRDYFCQYCDKVKGNCPQEDSSVGALLSARGLRA